MSLYRFHLSDPIYFHEDCRITMQQLGGASRGQLIELEQEGGPLKVTAIHHGGDGGRLLLEEPECNEDWKSFDAPDNTFCTYYRRDDVCATAYFFLDSPVSKLPPVPEVTTRLIAVRVQEKRRPFRNNGRTPYLPEAINDDR